MPLWRRRVGSKENCLSPNRGPALYFLSGAKLRDTGTTTLWICLSDQQLGQDCCCETLYSWRLVTAWEDHELRRLCDSQSCSYALFASEVQVSGAVWLFTSRHPFRRFWITRLRAKPFPAAFPAGSLFELFAFSFTNISLHSQVSFGGIFIVEWLRCRKYGILPILSWMCAIISCS